MVFDKLDSFLKILNKIVSEIMNLEIFDCELNENESIV